MMSSDSFLELERLPWTDFRGGISKFIFEDLMNNFYILDKSADFIFPI